MAFNRTVPSRLKAGYFSTTATGSDARQLRGSVGLPSDRRYGLRASSSLASIDVSQELFFHEVRLGAAVSLGPFARIRVLSVAVGNRVARRFAGFSACRLVGST